MIDLDHQATTPLAPEALAAMLPWLEPAGGANPHSAHAAGRVAAAAVAAARDEIVATLGGDAGAGTLVFTGGATEALNWALKGTIERGTRRRIVVGATEHAAVLDSARWLASQGADLVVLPVDRDGIVSLDAARSAIDANTAIVALMHVNNEIGTIAPLADVARLARAAGAAMLVDAVQSFGKLVVPVADADLIALSAHKIYGPKGVGALWIREGHAPAPLLHGGGQEAGLRSGTLSPALCAGFGAAARVARATMADDAAHVAALFDRARAALGSDWVLNGPVEARWRGNFNVRRDGLDAARLVSELRGIAFSVGSACASGSGRPSHVLSAIGLDDRQARSSIRLGFGRGTTAAMLDEAVARILAAADAQGSGA